MGFRIPQRVTLVCTISSFQSCGFVWSSGKDGSDRNTKTLRWVTFANFASSGFWNDARIRPLMKSIRPSLSSSPMVDDEPRVYEPSVSCLYRCAGGPPDSAETWNCLDRDATALPPKPGRCCTVAKNAIYSHTQFRREMRR